MNILFADMDNTIIYSYKHDIGDKKIKVEKYNGRQISFISEKTQELLKKVRDKMLIVPTSTRTVEQYERIDLKIGKLPYALVCNGGVLLENGVRNQEWYEESVALIRESLKELQKAMEILDKDPHRKFELRFIEELFVFTKCEEPKKTVEYLKKQVDTKLVEVFHNGEKVYVVPVNLSKGIAVKRFRKKMHPQYVLAAGDSEFDVSMVEEADAGFVPHKFTECYHTNGNVMEMPAGKLFSEALLENCLAHGIETPHSRETSAYGVRVFF